MAKLKDSSKAGERRTLRKYLTRYFRVKEKRKILQERLHKLQRERQKQGGLYASLFLSEIESRIQSQTDAMQKRTLEIMDVLELLPEDSMERTIMELRHIDCKPWEEICGIIHFSRSQCFRYYSRGLDALLAADKVRCILGLSKNVSGG